jgi:hypothetical protein
MLYDGSEDGRKGEEGAGVGEVRVSSPLPTVAMWEEEGVLLNVSKH